MSGSAERKGERAVIVLVVHRVTKLVEHGAHPPLVLADVAQHANVTFMIHIQAEGMLRLSFPFVKIRAPQQIFDVQPNAVVMRPGEGFDIRIFKDLVQRFAGAGGREFLKERVTIKPRIVFAIGHAVFLFERRI